ncbi:MAG: hypothetical protein AVDCRST_MAG78-231, partial [uncultured Rubrobacteraceae bacterium]
GLTNPADLPRDPRALRARRRPARAAQPRARLRVHPAHERTFGLRALHAGTHPRRERRGAAHLDRGVPLAVGVRPRPADPAPRLRRGRDSPARRLLLPPLAPDIQRVSPLRRRDDSRPVRSGALAHHRRGRERRLLLAEV